MTVIGETKVVIDEATGEAVAEVDGVERWRYVYSARKRPFVHPVTTAAGHVLTRNAPEDHPWHHGLWFTIKFVNGENFWEEYDEYGVLRHLVAPKLVHDGDRVSVVGELSWIRPDRETVVIKEERRVTHVPIDERSYAIDFGTTLVPEADVVLDRTEFTTWGGYSGLAYRGRGDFHDTRIRLDDGSVQDRTLGLRSKWLDITGAVGGDGADAIAGLTFFDPPGSPNHPVPWYASNRADTYGEEWGNFVNAAFLWDGPRPVARHQPLSFDYRVIVHDGELDDDTIEELYDDYLVEIATANL